VRGRRRVATLVAGLGVAQLLMWGALYYAIAVIGAPMRAELGVTEGEVFGAFTWALILAGVLAPWAGRLLDRHGGRVVLCAGAQVGVVGFVVLSRAQSFPELFVGWSLNGVAMALGLYDTCFAALGQVAPQGYRRAVTGVTLIAGFASSVSWPLSHWLLESLGWRGLCHLYAGALGVSALLCYAVLPALSVRTPSTGAAGPPSCTPNPAPRRVAILLAFALAGASWITSAMSAHLPSALQAVGVPTQRAVWAASSVGVTQVLGRVLVLMFSSRHDASRLGLVTFGLLCASMGLLLVLSSAPWAVMVFTLVYGIANGLLTIAKATLPVEMFGLKNVGAVLGSFNAASLVTRALAPLGFALTTGSFGTRGALMGIALVGVATLAAYIAAIRQPV
jgi:MFS family permease